MRWKWLRQAKQLTAGKCGKHAGFPANPMKTSWERGSVDQNAALHTLSSKYLFYYQLPSAGHEFPRYNRRGTGSHNYLKILWTSLGKGVAQQGASLPWKEEVA
jgi:hypothetical protein